MHDQLGQPLMQVASFRVKKHDRFREFRQHIAGEWGIPPERQFWWGWEARNNHTYRPQTRLSEVEDTMKVIDIKEKSQGNSKPWPPRLHLFLQVSLPNVRLQVLGAEERAQPSDIS